MGTPFAQRLGLNPNWWKFFCITHLGFPDSWIPYSWIPGFSREKVTFPPNRWRCCVTWAHPVQQSYVTHLDPRFRIPEMKLSLNQYYFDAGSAEIQTLIVEKKWGKSSVKHCQRHNGPRNWLISKTTGGTTWISSKFYHHLTPLDGATDGQTDTRTQR